MITAAVQVLSVLVITCIRKTRRASAVAHVLLVAGLVAGFANTVFALFDPGYAAATAQLFPFTGNLFRFDPLGLFFLAVIQLVAIPTSVYSYSYFSRYNDTDKPVKSTLIFIIILMLSVQMIVVANHAILFLIFWEIMSITAYLGMIFEKEKKEVQNGSFYYLVISHVAMYLLFVFFLLLHKHTGSWLFSDFHVSPNAGTLFTVLYLLALVAFGIKAGFMPFHFWLPRAHPIAPTVLSAFLSGIIIKLGIFGILRTFQFLSPTPEWIGWLVLVVSMTSAIFGVWYALAQHDIKRLLAYHSVENIGIIGIGIGIGMIGAANNSSHIQYLGFGGALLHTFNHAVFKSLLFMGSGVIYQNLHTREIDLMGGIVHRGRIFMIFFLIGSVAICGIPPLNGFISEFIIFNGFFSTARELRNYYPLLMLILTVGLAFVGGLAVACFSKINAVMFLGTPRSETHDFRITVWDYIPLGMLAALCVGIGAYPRPFINVINNVLAHGFITTGQASSPIGINWLYVSFVVSLLFLGTALLFIVKQLIHARYGKRKAPAWGCGYEAQTPRMQYTASSYADELNGISAAILGYRKQGSISKSIFPEAARFESHAHDFVDHRIIIPGYRRISSFITRFEFMSFTDIRYYIAFILIIIIVYCLMAFLWT
jgi:hydrogenase-4 component B